MQALGARLLVDGDLLRRGRIPPVHDDQLGAGGLPLHAPVEEQVAVRGAGEGVQLVGELQLRHVRQVLLGVEVRAHHALARPGGPAGVHLRGSLARHVPEQLHEPFARLVPAPAAGQARALIEHALDHPLAVRLAEEHQLRLPVLVRVQVRVRPVLGERGEVVSDLAVRVQHDVAEEHLRLAVHLLVVGVVLGEALDEPERHRADRAVESRAGGALGHLLDLELVGHLVRGDPLEELALACVRQRHAQVLRAGDAEDSLLHGEDVGFEELAIRVVEDVGDPERRLVLEAVGHVPPGLADQAPGDAGDGVLPVVEVEAQSGGAVVVQVVIVTPAVLEVPHQVLARALGNDVRLLRPTERRAPGHLREAPVLRPRKRERGPGP